MASNQKRKGLTIGELADQAGIGVETVRYYEKEGLLDQPPRPIGTFRTYEQDAVDRLGFVHEAKELGFTLKEIRDLIALRSNPATDAAAVRGRAVAKLTQIEHKLMQFERMRATLRDLLANCPGSGDLNECPIVQALSVTKTTMPVDAPSKRGGRATKGIDLKTIEMTIKGMHCEGCAGRIEREWLVFPRRLVERQLQQICATLGA